MISIKLWALIVLCVLAFIGALVSILFITDIIIDIGSHLYWKRKFKDWNKKDE